ncbi:hypothetical protein D3C72_1959710 [compost metagenome]
MAVTDGRDVVIGIQITTPLFIEEPNTLPSNGMERSFVEKTVRRAQQTLAALNQASFRFRKPGCVL